MLKVYEIGKEYDDKIALNGIDLTFPDKGLVIIKGESGSGKTTQLAYSARLSYVRYNDVLRSGDKSKE